jgi:hypothetical protein
MDDLGERPPVRFCGSEDNCADRSTIGTAGSDILDRRIEDRPTQRFVASI